MVTFVVLVTLVAQLPTGILANKLIEKVNRVPFYSFRFLGEQNEYNNTDFVRRHTVFPLSAVLVVTSGAVELL